MDIGVDHIDVFGNLDELNKEMLEEWQQIYSTLKVSLKDLEPEKRHLLITLMRETFYNGFMSGSIATLMKLHRN